MDDAEPEPIVAAADVARPPAATGARTP